jgi:hypothetical protein
MKRRAFLGKLLAGVGAVVAAPFVPLPRPNPFTALTAANLGLFNPSADVARDYQTGISIRLIRQYDVVADRWPSRLGVMQRRYNAARSAQLELVALERRDLVMTGDLWID